MRLPQVNRIADRFFSSVVEVVAERANLRLALHCGDELALVRHDDIPVLGAAEVPGDRDLASSPDFYAEFCERLELPGHEFVNGLEVSSAGHRPPRAGISSPGISLFLGLQIPTGPKGADGRVVVLERRAHVVYPSSSDSLMSTP